MTNKLRNRTLSIILCLSIVLPYLLGLLTIKVEAATVKSKTIDGVTYAITAADGYDFVLKITGTGTITNAWQDQLYTESKGNRYYYYGAIGEIIIDSNNLTSINANAFGSRSTPLPSADSGHGDCTTMHDLNVVKINKYNNGNWDSPVFQNHDTILKIVIGQNISTLSPKMFYGMKALTTVQFNNWAKVAANKPRVIEESLFENCKKLNSVSGLGAKCLTTIKKNAFKNCEMQTDLVLGKNITEIQEGAFQNCSGIRNIHLGTKATKAEKDEDDSTLVTIGNNAFSGCRNLANITTLSPEIGRLPKTLTSVGDGAFKGCIKLSRLRFPNNDVTNYPTIGNNAIESFTMIVGYGATKEDETAAKTWAETNNHFNYIWYGDEKTFKRNNTNKGYVEFTTEHDAIYTFELYGAKGGNSSFTEEGGSFSSKGANGSLVKAQIEMKQGDILHLYMGDAGGSPAGGANGGGAGYSGTISETYDGINFSGSVVTGGGGGYTSINTVKSSYKSGKWVDANNSNLGYDPRILVAGGGGGGNARPYFNSYGKDETSLGWCGGWAPLAYSQAGSNSKKVQGSSYYFLNSNTTPGYFKDSEPKVHHYPVSGGGGGGYYGGKTQYESNNGASYAYAGTNYIQPSTQPFTLTTTSGEAVTRATIDGSGSASAGSGADGAGQIICKIDVLEHVAVKYNSNHSDCNSIEDNNYEVWYDKEILNTSDKLIAVEQPDIDIFTPTPCDWLHQFVCWNTKADGTGTDYHPGDEIPKSLFAEGSKEITLYAIYRSFEYTVRLHKNQPTSATSTIQVPDASDYTNKNTYYEKTFYYNETRLPNTSFYTLTGWHTENIWYKTKGSNGSASGDSFNGGDKNLTTTEYDTVNLYPNWIANTYTINYSGNNTTYNIYGDTVSTTYTGETAATECTYDSNVTLATNGFSKTGYTFKEWNTKSDGTGTSYSSGQTLTKPNFTATNGGSITLYAIWEPIKYTVKFNGNSNFNSQNAYTQSFRFDESKALTENKFDRNTPYTWGGITLNQRYNYINWGESSNQTTSDYTDKETVVNLRDTAGTFNLYALWKKNLTLDFDLNGGKYKGSTDNIVLSSTIYNSTKSYTFDLENNQTAENLPSYTVQTNTIDAYGIYDDNGLNSVYTKTNEDGTYCRFLGWSTNKNATEPDTQFIVYNADRTTQYTIYDNTTLYAVWEPVLTVFYQAKRTLGSEDENLVGKVVADTSKSNYNAYLVAKPGEQCEYSMIAAGPDKTAASVTFDQKITNIYDNNGTWTDTLNPNPTNNDDLQVDGIPKSQKHGLNRTIQLLNKFKQSRKFYIPLYLGTGDSEPTSIGVTNYTINNEFTASSFYSRYVLNSDEKIVITTNVIIANSDGELITVLDELRTKLKIRIKDINS